MPTGVYKRKSPGLLEAFNRRVIRRDGCWGWRGSLQTQGYGQIQVNRILWLAHRLSWTLFRGPIPEGLNVLHSCDNPECSNPDHLFLGTHQDNMKDKMDKRRHRGPDWTPEQRRKRGEASRLWWLRASEEQKAAIHKVGRGSDGRFK